MALDPKKRQKKLAKQKQKDKARRKAAAQRRPDAESMPRLPAGGNDDGPEMSPALKTELVGVIRNQIRNGDPPVARETFDRLRREQFTETEAEQLMARALFLEMGVMLTQQQDHNPERYAAGLRMLPRFPGEE